jgi:hypothetical protein
VDRPIPQCPCRRGSSFTDKADRRQVRPLRPASDEWAGWSPAKGGKLLIVREAKCEGRVTRRFEVLRADTLVTEKSAGEPQQLAAFGLWADAGWRRETLSLR